MLKSLVLAAALVSASVIPACYATGTAAYVSDEDPPPPREEVVTVRPGFVFIHGNWQRDHGRWAWHEGRYERERANQRYVEGRWQRQGNRRIWIEGQWTSQGGVTVR
jgi:WXXGXW repeat (2 copies)